MDEAILLNDVLHFLASHAVNRIPDVDLGCDQNGKRQQNDNGPNIVQPKVDIINVNPPSVIDQD
jgi:hypothetical protein